VLDDQRLEALAKWIDARRATIWAYDPRGARVHIFLVDRLAVALLPVTAELGELERSALRDGRIESIPGGLAQEPQPDPHDDVAQGVASRTFHRNEATLLTEEVLALPHAGPFCAFVMAYGLRRARAVGVSLEPWEGGIYDGHAQVRWDPMRPEVWRFERGLAVRSCSVISGARMLVPRPGGMSDRQLWATLPYRSELVALETKLEAKHVAGILDRLGEAIRAVEATIDRPLPV
jgi:hypothetical protein